MRLNLGCGTDIREGWLNVDREPVDGAVYGDMAQLKPPAYGVHVRDGAAEVVLVNHALHYLTYAHAEWAFDEWVRVLAPGGQLVIVEPSIMDVIGSAWMGPNDYGRDTPPVEAVLALTDDETEPTRQGKVLRWACWHGERSSLWSWQSLTERLERRGLDAHAWFPGQKPMMAWAGNREQESFVVTATR